DRGRGSVVREYGVFLFQRRPNAVYESDTLLQERRPIRRAGGGNIAQIVRGNRLGGAVLLCALDLKNCAGGIVAGPRQGHRMIIERYRGQILRGQKRRRGGRHKRSSDARRSA